MAAIYHKLNRNVTVVLIFLWCLSTRSVQGYERKMENRLKSSMDEMPDEFKKLLSTASIDLITGETNKQGSRSTSRDFASNNSYELMFDQIKDFVRSHPIDIKLSFLTLPEKSLETARFSLGKNSFLTGFGLGFLAFGLKKLLLPIFIGAQIVKSILIAMFLPSILGSVGKLVGKGVSTFAQSSGASNLGAATSDNINDFDFKDAVSAQTSPNLDSEIAGSDTGYNTFWAYPSSNSVTNQLVDSNNIYTYPEVSNYVQESALGAGSVAPPFNPISWGYNTYHEDASNLKNPTVSIRLTEKPKDDTTNKYFTGSFYTKDKIEDFKEFHNIPSSSHLLANYDPFYSPLLSRMDTVFKQLGYSTEICRERLVCNMYKNPAKYAPFSNLVSAQLSRELNELRKPSTDNPEILRFFKYMKAAKDGQDCQECDKLYSECTTTRAASENAPMVSAYNEINKLVLARSL